MLFLAGVNVDIHSDYCIIFKFYNFNLLILIKIINQKSISILTFILIFNFIILICAIFSGDTVDIHSDQSVCVLPSSGGNYSPYVTSGTSFRQIFDIRHDISFIKVSSSNVVDQWYLL